MLNFKNYNSTFKWQYILNILLFVLPFVFLNGCDQITTDEVAKKEMKDQDAMFIGNTIKKKELIAGGVDKLNDQDQCGPLIIRHLKYYYDKSGAPPSASASQISEGFALWQNPLLKTRFTIEQVESEGLANVIIKWSGSYRYGWFEVEPISWGATYSRPEDCADKNTPKFQMWINKSQQGAIDNAVYVYAHEWGHVLGLGHLDDGDPLALMSNSKNPRTTLSQADIDRFNRVYPPPPPPPAIYASKCSVKLHNGYYNRE